MELRIRKSEELLKCGKHKGLQVRNLWFFVAEKRLQRLIGGLLQLFALIVCVRFLQYAQFALAIIARKPTEYCLSMRYGDPVRIRNNRPLLCLVPPLPSVRKPAVSIGFITL